MSDEKSLFTGNRSDLRNIISWQQERYQHIQSLSQGLLTSAITILAVVATVYTALGSPVPQIPFPKSSHGPNFMSVISSQLIIGFSNFIWFTLGTVAIIMFCRSGWKFSELVLERPLMGEMPSNRVITYSSVSFNQASQPLQIKDVSNFYLKSVNANNKKISIMRDRFRNAGFRFLASILLSIVAIEIYFFSINYNINAIFGLAVITIGSPLTHKALLLLTSKQESEDLSSPMEITLYQEMLLDEDHIFNRWGNIEISWWERIGKNVIGLFSLLVVIIYTGSLVI